MNWAFPFLRMRSALERYAKYAELGDWEGALAEWEEVNRWSEEVDLANRCLVNAREIRERSERPSLGEYACTPYAEEE